ncbi:MAG: hypothetical protein ACREK7_02220, partial [Gemmatimonadota bacterium]
VMEEPEAVLEVHTPRPLQEIEIDPDAWLLHELVVAGVASGEIEPPGPIRAYKKGGAALAGAG